MTNEKLKSLPFARSYWVVPGKILAGYYPGSLDPEEASRRLAALVRCGIRCVINLMEPDEVDHTGHPFAPYGPTLLDLGRTEGFEISVKRFPIRDLDVPSAETMNAILDEIDRCMGQDAPVYVHCWGGRGRTGTVVGCYLVRHGLTGEGALRRIAELRRNQPDDHLPSPEMRDQVKMVRDWVQRDRKRK